MRDDLGRQQAYWDNQVADFDSIYEHSKSAFSNWIDSTFRWDMYARYEYTLKNSEPIRGRSFLDVGCGTGRYSLEYARRGAGRVVGIDIAEHMLAVCRDRARAERLDECCDFIRADLLEFEPPGAFDVCIGIGLFDYIRDALPVVAKMRAVVTDRAIMSFPRFWTWRAPVRRARLAIRGCDVYFYTRAHISSLISQGGFARFEIEQVGQLYCVTAFV
jgi:cyclopropane fatty-acyl-phospholipid synthase-like methyltransferase